MGKDQSNSVSSGGARAKTSSIEGSTSAGGFKRMTSARKQSAVLRLLRGEPLDMLSRELQVTAADLSEWRDKFLAAGEASLKARPRDGREAEINRLKSVTAQHDELRNFLTEPLNDESTDVWLKIQSHRFFPFRILLAAPPTLKLRT